MDLTELRVICDKKYMALERKASSLSLLKKLFDGPMELDAVEAFIDAVDRETCNRLEVAIEDRFMDAKRLRLNRKEQFMLRQRFGNAAFMLQLLTRAPASIRHGAPYHPSNISKECIAWALQTLWDMNCIQWGKRAASAFCYGEKTVPSSIPEIDLLHFLWKMR